MNGKIKIRHIYKAEELKRFAKLEGKYHHMGETHSGGDTMRIVFEDDLQRALFAYLHLFGDVAKRADFKDRRFARNGERERTVEVGGRSSRVSLDEHSGSDHRIADVVHDLTFDGKASLGEGVRDTQSEEQTTLQKEKRR